MKPARVYLANAVGFSRLLSPAVARIRDTIQAAGWTVFEPFEGSAAEGTILTTISTSKDSLKTIKERSAAVNKTIGERNTREIEGATAVVAVLDGTLDIDSGVAAEIGYACAKGKPVIALRTDFRLACDNFGSTVNLQVEHFIAESGGCIVDTVEAVIAALDALPGD